MDGTKTTEITTSRSEILSDAKRKFLEDAGKVDFLKPLREHPWATVGSSALAGVVVGTLSGIVKAPARAGRDVGIPAAGSTAAPISVPVAEKPNLMVLVQPLLIRGATLAFNWWMAKRADRVAAESSQQASDAETNPQAPAEPI